MNPGDTESDTLADVCTAVDVLFPLSGQSLARDHAAALQQALCHQWPWLAGEGVAGVHPVRLVPGSGALALLSRRTPLVLRVPASRAAELLRSPGVTLQVGGQALVLGPAHLRQLVAHGTLYAPRVAADGADEGAFMAGVAQALDALGVHAQRVCGLRQSLRLAGRRLPTFSLLLHQLTPRASLRLQTLGLGPHRLLGCGVFVPHRSAAPV